MDCQILEPVRLPMIQLESTTLTPSEARQLATKLIEWADQHSRPQVNTETSLEKQDRGNLQFNKSTTQ